MAIWCASWLKHKLKLKIYVTFGSNCSTCGIAVKPTVKPATKSENK